MDARSWRDWRGWRDGVLLGAAVGAVVLGVGGRMVMRAIAYVIYQDPTFTIKGSLTVVFAGTVSGAGGGALLVMSRLLFPTSGLFRQLAFWISSLAIAFVVIWPVNPVRLEFFLPLVATFGVLLQVLSVRATRRRRQSSLDTPASVS